MAKKITYSDVGVNREQRAESKKALKKLRETYKYSHQGSVKHLPYGNIFPFKKDTYLDLVIEGVGTKVLVAQLANKYDTIGIDAVAMAVNDVIRSGATPIAMADNIHALASDPSLVKGWLEGITKGAKEAECPVTSGEIGDVAEIIRGLTPKQGFDMIISVVGHVKKNNIITGKSIKPGDPIIGLSSSGLHSNGISLARKILFKQWGGKFDKNTIPNNLNKPIVQEVLEPTKIYVKTILELNKEVKIKAAVHITGNGYLKFGNLARFSPGIGFEFIKFKPQPIFSLIQDTAKDLGYILTDEEMFKTFNMGWGFAIITDKKDQEKALNILEKSDNKPTQIGKITDSDKITVSYKNKKIILK
ncbi:MAG: phosphoribosylformylglycinamidine cyclo-ligase [Candidatus Bathyarchaeota archaeon]|nr:phosphoribosylformylglycinamidine cyclo-ligase [Candidatus Bathyarchaeota archaeon]